MDAGPSSSRYMMIVQHIQDYDDQQMLSRRMAAALVASAATVSARTISGPYVGGRPPRRKRGPRYGTPSRSSVCA